MADTYGKRIEHGLVDKEMSIERLAVLVSEKTGMYCDQPLISKIKNGQIKAESRPVIVSAINEILCINSITDEVSNKTDS